jgi:hypothetical protein
MAESNQLFTKILDELHYLYLLGFTPQTPDGKVHELTVKVKDPKLLLRARQHYLAPQGAAKDSDQAPGNRARGQ